MKKIDVLSAASSAMVNLGDNIYWPVISRLIDYARTGKDQSVPNGCATAIYEMSKLALDNCED